MISSEIVKFLFFILIGGIIGIIFDLFRILRKCFKTSDIITYIHDLMFLLISALILLFSIFIVNNGEIRGYMFLGIALGIVVYLISISKYIINICTKIILFIRKIIINPIMKSIIKFCNFTKKIVKKVYNNLSKNLKITSNKEKHTKNLTNFNK